MKRKLSADMMNAITECVARLATIPYFPTDQTTRALIADEVESMCPTPESAVWLGKRAPKLYGEWPGPKELRALLCSKFRPADGVNAYSTLYADGIPAERETKTAAALPTNKPVAQIEAPVSEEDYRRAMETLANFGVDVGKIAAAKTMPSKPDPMASKPLKPRQMRPDPITPERRREIEEMFARAEEERRRKKA